jgi:predicted ester cyclase
MDRRLLITGAALARPAAAQDAASISLVERFAATLTAHDITGFAALFADDDINHQTSAAVAAPPPGKTDKQLSVAFFAARLAGMPDLKVTIEASVASPGKVAASFVYTGTHGGTYFGIAPTGKALRFTSCDIFTARGNQFAEHWGMGDLAGTLAQLKS